MENLLDEPEKELTFTDQEIFTQIWTQRRAVFQYIHDFKYDKFVVPLLILAGISRAFNRAVEKDLGDTLTLLPLILVCVLSGGLLGWLSYYIYASLVSWTGKWLDGQGDTSSILRIIAYAMIPIAIALVLTVVQISIYGIEIFKAEGDIFSADTTSNIIFFGSAIFEIILSICTLIFCVISVSIVQQLNIGKTILNLILPILIILVPILLYALLVGGL